MFVCGEWGCDQSYPNLVGMLSGPKGTPEIGHMLTQCREAVIENRCHGHLLNIHCQPKKSVLLIVLFFSRGKYYTHALFTICCNREEFFLFVPFRTEVRTGILMCYFLSPTSSVFSGFVRL
jgi:hypothetical protein